MTILEALAIDQRKSELTTLAVLRYISGQKK
jgi:hypothetical protein